MSHTRRSCKFQVLSFAEAPVAVDGADSRALGGSLCLVVLIFMGLLEKDVKEQVLGEHKFAGKSSVSSMGKIRDWVLQVAGIWVCVVGGRAHSEPSMLHGRK